MEKPSLFEQYRPLLPFAFGGMVAFPFLLAGTLIFGLGGFITVCLLLMLVGGLIGLAWYFQDHME